MGYPLFFHIVPSLFSGFGIESCALGLTAITGVVPGDIHPVGVADILFVINAVGGTAINRKAGAWMFRSVGVSVLLEKLRQQVFSDDIAPAPSILMLLIQQQLFLLWIQVFALQDKLGIVKNSFLFAFCILRNTVLSLSVPLKIISFEK